MDRVVSFPIYPHLKKFIVKKFESDMVGFTPDGNEIINVSVTSSLGIYMTHALKSKKTLQRDLDRMTDEIHFSLCHDLPKHSLRQGYLIYFNRTFDRLFKENMQTWVDAQFRAGVNNTQSIMAFLDHYKINETDYSFHSARSAYYDKRPNSIRRKKTLKSQSI